MVDQQKPWNFDLQCEKNFGYIAKQLRFLNLYIALELQFNIEKLWYFGINYGSIKTYN